VGLKPTGNKCIKEKQRGKCRGELRDSLLDWEDALPIQELSLSERACKSADLCLCLGTSLQIMPCGNFPLLTKKNGGKIVMINLQKTKMDKHATLVIHSKLDDVFERLFEKMKLSLNKTQERIVLHSENSREIDKKICLSVDNVIFC
jgi:NAD+-dependent protein deacetylase sirtuin 6